MFLNNRKKFISQKVKMSNSLIILKIKFYLIGISNPKFEKKTRQVN
jgi:hypothetical protein